MERISKQSTCTVHFFIIPFTQCSRRLRKLASGCKWGLGPNVVECCTRKQTTAQGRTKFIWTNVTGFSPCIYISRLMKLFRGNPQVIFHTENLFSVDGRNYFFPVKYEREEIFMQLYFVSLCYNIYIIITIINIITVFCLFTLAHLINDLGSFESTRC